MEEQAALMKDTWKLSLAKYHIKQPKFNLCSPTFSFLQIYRLKIESDISTLNPHCYFEIK